MYVPDEDLRGRNTIHESLPHYFVAVQPIGYGRVPTTLCVYSVQVNPFRRRICQVFSSDDEQETMSFIDFLDMVSGLSPKVRIDVQWNLCIKDTLNKENLSNEETVCSPNHVNLCADLPLN